MPRVPGLPPVPLRPERRRARRAPDLHLHAHAGRCGPEQPLDGAREAHTPRCASCSAAACASRTLYVMPYCMGPIDSPLSRCGVEITDSAYVVLNMPIMTRMGRAALERIAREGSFVRGLHSIGELDPERRFIMHFPEELSIESFGSGYGGNALLGKKCHALRIASWQARTEGWLAEHMLIVGLAESAGRDALRRLRLPLRLRQDQPRDADPARLAAGLEGVHGRRRHRLAAPGAGRAAVGDQSRVRLLRRGARHQPGDQSQRLRDDPARHDLHQRRADCGQPALVGRTRERQAGARLAGSPVRPGAADRRRIRTRASRSRRSSNPSYSPHAEDPRGVPISALVFGGRRRELAPLVYEARDWQHGVLVGASVASETTAAATGQVGVVRRDPMAMKPFCGLQLRRLLAALAQRRRQARPPAADLPRQLVPPGCAGKVPLAGLRREPARARLDARALRRQGRRQRDRDRLPAATAGPEYPGA